MTEELTFFSKINKYAQEARARYPRGIPTTNIPSILPRNDNNSIYEEGERFAGSDKEGSSLAYITLIASPHIKPTIEKDIFIEAAKENFKKDPELPIGIEDVTTLSSQLGIWWNDLEEESGSKAFHELYTLPESKRRDICRVISRQTSKAVEFVEDIKGRPTLWGSWGYATDEERSATGGGRGGPTNSAGHIHVTHFNNAEQQQEYNQTSPQQELSFVHPWEKVFCQEMGNDFSLALQSIIRDSVPEGKYIDIQKITSNSVHDTGFSVSISGGLPLDEIFYTLVEIGGRTSQGYEKLREAYNNFHKRETSDSEEDIYFSMQEAFMSMGFPLDTVSHAIEFITKLRPTVGQLTTWRKELLEKEKTDGETPIFLRKDSGLERVYTSLVRSERIKNRLDRMKKVPDSLLFLYDTLKAPDEFKSVILTWPVHASFGFIIDDFQLDNGTIMVNKIDLIPLIGTTETGPVRKLDMLIGRALPSVVSAQTVVIADVIKTEVTLNYKET